MEITLTPDIEETLLERARLRGGTPEELALESLRRQFVHPMENEHPVEAEDRLADFLADYIGVLHGHEYIDGGARMSEAIGDTFAKSLIEKRRPGRL